MNKPYTAQEMRAIADSDDFSAYGYDDPKYHADPDCAEIDVTQMVREMLRQAADALEREKKYEYAAKYLSVDDETDVISKTHYESAEQATVTAVKVHGIGHIVIRRYVGEWEEVK